MVSRFFDYLCRLILISILTDEDFRSNILRQQYQDF